MSRVEDVKELDDDIEAIISANTASGVTTVHTSDKIMNMAIFFSMWLLSCIIAYTYWYKTYTTLEYNKLVKDKNTREMDFQMKRLSRVTKTYMDTVTSRDSGTSGLTKLKRKLYQELILTLQVFDKCNYIKMKNAQEPFPYTEILISSVILFIISGIVVMSNFLNNPMDKMQIGDKIERLRREVTSMDNFASKGTIKEDFEDKVFLRNYKKELEDRIRLLNEDETLSDEKVEELNRLRLHLRNFEKGPAMQGGDGDFTEDEIRRLNMIRMKNNKLMTEINFLKSDAAFNQGTMTVIILVSTFYMAMTLLLKSNSYVNNLYTGRLFHHSKCV